MGARRGKGRAETFGSDHCHHLHPQQSPAQGMARMDPETQSHQEEKGSLLPACSFAIRGMPSFPKQGGLWPRAGLDSQQKAGKVRNIASNATCGLKTAFSRFHKQQKHKPLDLWTDKTCSFRGCASAWSQWGLSPGKPLDNQRQALGTSPTPPQISCKVL